MSAPRLDDLLKAPEAAARIHITPTVLMRKAQTGEIRAFKPGRSWLFSAADLDAYVAASENRPPAGSPRRRTRHRTP